MSSYPELNLKSRSGDLLATFENIFIYEGRPGHEMDIVESGKVINKAVWCTVAEIELDGAKLYPNGLKKALARQQL